jgi:hypothetical protein
MRRLSFLCLSLLLLAAPAYSEVIPFTLEVGYRWAKVNGNDDVYRTQLNERSGLLLRTFSLSTPGFRIDSSDLGAGPAGSLRIEAAKPGAYRLRFGYRQMDAFSALPGFANPLLSQGIVVGQHALDRTRTLVDADLEILPDRAITPFIGYSWNRNDGPGQTTYFVGQDEFRLLQSLKETDRELRAGTSFRFSSFYGQVTQGWRRFRGNEVLTLAPGAGAGNNNTPILGQPVNADELTRSSRTSVDTPFTNVFVAGAPLSRVKLIGNYVRFAADSDGLGNESLTGSFVSFPLSRDFTGLTESASGRVKNTTWRGSGRAEVVLAPGIDFVGGYQREHRELDGSSLINTLYLQAITFGGLDRKDLETVLNSSNSLNRNEDVWNAGISARSLGPFAVRADFRQTDQDFTIAPDLSEIVVPGSQGGIFKRRVRTFDTGVTFAKAGFTAGASWKNDRADTPVFRTDFLDRDRYRARAGWTSKARRVSLGVSAEQTDQSNRSDIGFNGKLRQYTGDIEIAPITQLRLRGGVSQYRSDTDILFRRPENFTIDSSVHKENGRSREGGIGLSFAKASLDAGFMRFTNSGSIPFDIDRYRVRATINLKAKTGLAAEWSRDQYRETNFAISNFDADRYGLYLRWLP